MDNIPDIARLASTITGNFILRGKDAVHLTVFEWERDGTQIVAWPDDGQTPPYDAAKIGLKLYNFPTGQVRLIDFETGTRTPIHRCSHQDALFYGLSATQIEFVDNATHHAFPGDASLHPEGTYHHSETILAGTRVEFGFTPSKRCGHDLIAFSGREMTLHTVCDTVLEGRKTRTFRSQPDMAGVHFRARYFQFPVYAILEAHYSAGSTLPLHKNTGEKIVYIISGEADVTTDTETARLSAGDVFRMGDGRLFALAALSDLTLIEVDGTEPPWAYTFPEAAHP